MKKKKLMSIGQKLNILSAKSGIQPPTPPPPQKKGKKGKDWDLISE